MLTNGNQKLGTDVWNFNLPRFTCKQFRNELCDKYCYAKRNNFLNPWVIESMNRNYIESKRKDFIDLISEQIEDSEIKYIRLHSSGDFYSEVYYKKWLQIARRFKKYTKILAYTRNIKIKFYYSDFNNFVIYNSLHFDYEYKKINQNINHTLKRKAYITNLDRIPRHMEEHPSGARYCSSKCYKCKHCFNSKKGNIVFVINMTDKGHTFREHEEQLKLL